MVGLQGSFMDALGELVQLDYDAVAAYEAAINNISLPKYKNSREDFKKDHEKHIKVFSKYIEANGEIPPDGPGAKSFLTQGKVVLANLVGDRTILRAMRSNEEDTNTAYKRLNSYENIPSNIVDDLKEGLEDERRHAAWLESVLQNK